MYIYVLLYIVRVYLSMIYYGHMDDSDDTFSIFTSLVQLFYIYIFGTTNMFIDR